jgi:neutral trehalase
MFDKQSYFNETRSFITKSWDSLTRTLTRSETYGDPKTDDEPILYLPAEIPEPDAIKDLQIRCRVDVRRLPELVAIAGDVDLTKIENEGLLYLEHPYVVPGGQFNEMYGWDSYFIILGLLRDSRISLAKGMVENFFFELDHYGSVLNANRTYYLTRSQPPFLTSMILALFAADKSSGGLDYAWLARGYAYARRDYEQWANTPHLAGDTRLSRYFDHGDGPVPESSAIPKTTMVASPISSPSMTAWMSIVSSVLTVASPPRPSPARSSLSLVIQQNLPMAAPNNPTGSTIWPLPPISTKAIAACGNPGSTFLSASAASAARPTTTRRSA